MQPLISASKEHEGSCINTRVTSICAEERRSCDYL
jgi:hypothetical protein